MWLLGGFALLLVTAEMLILVANARTRYQAEALLRDVRSIKLSESTTDDVLRIVRHYPTAPGGTSSDCAAADESHSIRIANDIVNRVGFAIPALRVVGARPAGIVAVILLQKGRVCYVFYSFAVAHWTKIDDLRAEASEGLVNCDDEAKEKLSESCYDLGEGIIRNHIEKLDVRLSNLANATERQHAFDFDLSCLTSILGCQKLCVMNPSIWRDYLARARMQGWALPADVNDPSCRAIQ